jgi:hypothetical protein
LAIIVLCIVAMLWAGVVRYYPQVHVILPDRSELIMIDLPWSREAKCRDANAKMTTAIVKSCSQCKIFDSCDKQIDPVWLNALEGKPIKNYVVYSGTLRIVVNAGNASEPSCTALAEQIVRNQKQAARCVFPQ